MSEEANEIKARITDARISALETEVKELREQVKRLMDAHPKVFPPRNPDLYLSEFE